MMNIVPQWLMSLKEAERSLRSQGYIVVYGGMTSVVVPIGSSGSHHGNVPGPSGFGVQLRLALDYDHAEAAMRAVTKVKQCWCVSTLPT